MKKYIVSILIVIIMLFCVISIHNSFSNLLQNLGLNYSTSNLLSYIFILLVSALIYSINPHLWNK